MAGIRVVHDTARSTCHLVPVMQKPYADGGFVCPNCHILHAVKTVHLWLDDTGGCLVSQGVLDELRMAGMPGLSVAGEVANPPPLRIVKDATREQIDNDNRRVQLWTPTGRISNG